MAQQRLLLTHKPRLDTEFQMKAPFSQETIEDDKDISKVKSGSLLETHDLLFSLQQDRETFLPLLSDQYGIVFDMRVEESFSKSFTSKKRVIFDVQGNKYFLKQKPLYSLSEPQRTHSALMQSTLAAHLSFVTPVIFTLDGKPYSQIDSKTFLLTPYIDGTYYIGTEAQSVSCAVALAEIHKVSSNVLPSQEEAIDSKNEVLEFINMLEEMNFPDKELHKQVSEELQNSADKVISRVTRYGWLHGDFAPYNLVFDNINVIGVNDFDNVCYGPLSRDLAECLLTHCGINYAGPTSSLKAPIRTVFDTHRMRKMLKSYLGIYSLDSDAVIDISKQIIWIWLELLTLGLIRGDFSLQDVDVALRQTYEIRHSIDLAFDDFGL